MMHPAIGRLLECWHPSRISDDFLVKLRCDSVWDEDTFQEIIRLSNDALLAISGGATISKSVSDRLAEYCGMAIDLMNHPNFRAISRPAELSNEQYEAFLDDRAARLLSVGRSLAGSTS